VLGDTGAPAPDGESENVAAVMEQVCALRGCDFAVMAGDNIYEMGAVSELDPLFELAFEAPYAGLDMPFFPALGNHDNAHTLTGEGGANFKGDAQVAYTDSPLASGKWIMPDRYYTQTWPRDSETPLLELFVLDSSPITHFYDDPSPMWSGAALQGYIADQKVFLQDALAASKAKWKFALAHHPYISNGDHGNAGNFDVGAATDPCVIAGPLASPTCRGAEYKLFIEETICDQVDAFFTGHDHNLIWMEPTAACGKTHHILSGAASKERELLDPARNAAYYQQGGIFGFFWIELDANQLRGAVYEVEAGGEPRQTDGDGNPAPAFEMTLAR
jgi:tartrate-resistant acid phosphatase type 5